MARTTPICAAPMSSRRDCTDAFRPPSQGATSFADAGAAPIVRASFSPMSAWPRRTVEIGGVLQELRQRRCVERARDDEAIEVERGENLGHDPPRLACGLRPEEHEHAAVLDRTLKLIARNSQAPHETGSIYTVLILRSPRSGRLEGCSRTRRSAGSEMADPGIVPFAELRAGFRDAPAAFLRTRPRVAQTQIRLGAGRLGSYHRAAGRRRRDRNCRSNTRVRSFAEPVRCERQTSRPARPHSPAGVAPCGRASRALRKARIVKAACSAP